MAAVGRLDAGLSGPWPQAVLTSLLAAWLGAWCALGFARAGTVVRLLILAGLICLLALPAPPLWALPAWRAAPWAVAGALGRALALAALMSVPSAAAIPAGLWLAARAAGASWLRAWWDVVAVALRLPVALAILAAWLRQ